VIIIIKAVFLISNICCGEDRDVSLSSIETAKELEIMFSFIPTVSYFYRAQDDSITGRSPDELFIHDNNIITSKHNFTEKNRTMDRLMYDLPWSLFSFLPTNIKQPFRRPRDYVKSIFQGKELYEYSNDALLKY